ncbi:MAG: hypothetical protein U0X73_18915 [Thermoanaerobaculia bacterium]
MRPLTVGSPLAPRFRLARIALVALSVGASLVACAEKVEPTAEERTVIEPLLRGYLEGMAESYRRLDTAPLAGLAVPGLADRVRGNIQSIRDEGDRLEMKLLELEATHFAVLHHQTAVIECREVWDTSRIEIDSGRLLGRYERSEMRTQIQLLLQNGRWIVYDRHRLDSPAGG